MLMQIWWNVKEKTPSINSTSDSFGAYQVVFGATAYDDREFGLAWYKDGEWFDSYRMSHKDKVWNVEVWCESTTVFEWLDTEKDCVPSEAYNEALKELYESYTKLKTIEALLT